MRVCLRPLGDQGLLIQFGDRISRETADRIRRFCRSLEQYAIAGVLEWVPTYAAVAIYYRPDRIRYRRLCEIVQERVLALPQAALPPATLLEIPTCYGNDFGPDLEFVAASHGLSPAAVIAKHAEPTYFVHMIGFVPGFPYLGGLPAELMTPRLATPRPRIPAGSVGIAGPQTGVYPLETPGGWQIIGRTPLRLYDHTRQPPALLKAGDEVKFVPITREEYDRIAQNEH